MCDVRLKVFEHVKVLLLHPNTHGYDVVYLSPVRIHPSDRFDRASLRKDVIGTFDWGGAASAMEQIAKT